jgi:hypothetical protein
MYAALRLSNERLGSTGTDGGVWFMSRFRLLLLGLLAVLAVGAVSAASAETCTGGSSLVACSSPGNIPLVGELALGTGGLDLFGSILGGTEVKFHCSKSDTYGVLGKLGAGTGLFLLLNCKEEKPAGCKLSAADEKEIDSTFIARQQSLGLVLFTGAGAGEEFTSLHVEKNGAESCVGTGTFKVTGRQMAETPTGKEGKIEQEIVAKKSESFLKLGVEAGSFGGTTKLHLGGANIDSAWLVMHGE